MIEKQFTFVKQYEDILYKSDFDLGTLESEIYFILNKMWSRVGFNYETDIKNISDNLDLYDLKLWNYLLESDNGNYLNSIKENIENKWTEVKWEFEYKWKFYLILYRPKINWKIEIESWETKNQIDDLIK